MKTKVIKQIGYIIGGTAYLNLWGGDQGSINMEEIFIPINEFNRLSMLGAVNDNGFGVESIYSADIDIYIKYDNGSTEHDRTIMDVDSPIHTRHFLSY